MTTRRPGSGEPKLETGISFILISGVIVSIILELIGIILLYYTYGHLNISQDTNMFIKGHNFFSFIYETFSRKHPSGSAVLFMTAGVITLILTPYIRIIASVIYFAWEKNTKYVLITLFVLLVVTLSLALH